MGSFEATASCATLDLFPRFPQSYFCVVGMILKTDGIEKEVGVHTAAEVRKQRLAIDYDSMVIEGNYDNLYIYTPASQLILTMHLQIAVFLVSVS